MSFELLSGLGDFGCAVFIIESTNPKKLDKKLDIIIIEIEIWNLRLKFGI